MSSKRKHYYYCKLCTVKNKQKQQQQQKDDSNNNDDSSNNSGDGSCCCYLHEFGWRYRCHECDSITSYTLLPTQQHYRAAPMPPLNLSNYFVACTGCYSSAVSLEGLCRMTITSPPPVTPATKLSILKKLFTSTSSSQTSSGSSSSSSTQKKEAVEKARHCCYYKCPKCGHETAIKVRELPPPVAARYNDELFRFKYKDDDDSGDDSS